MTPQFDLTRDADKSLAAKFPEIAAEWHPTKNGDLTPDQVSAGSNEKVWWLGKCGHTWDATVKSRTGKSRGCPFKSCRAQFLESAAATATHYLGLVEKGPSIEHVYVESIDAYRFYRAVRGGGAIIVARDGSFLFANSSVPPVRHEEAFLGGRRTDSATLERPN